MPAHAAHGRRRAAVPTAGPRRGRRRQATTASRKVFRSYALFSAAATGVIVLAALPAAQAAGRDNSPAARPPAVASAPGPSAGTLAVTAASGAAVSYDRPSVGTVRARAARTSAAASAARAGQEQTAEPSGTPGQLRAPLAVLQVTSPFGLRANPFTQAAEMHTGTDFAEGCGTPVLASGAGTVTEAGWSPFGGGNRIVVDHGAGIKTTYNHLADIGVNVGQQVPSGGVIAGVGTTGMSTGCHLHFEVVLDGQTVDPQGFI